MLYIICICEHVINLNLFLVNLPPTLSKSQVSSVRKHLKLQLLNLLKMPTSLDYHGNITTLLTDLGATYQEVVKAYPKPEELRKYRQKHTLEPPQSDAPLKKIKLDADLEYLETEGEAVEDKRKHDTAVDITERFIMERLTPELAAQLVMTSMVR